MREAHRGGEKPTPRTLQTSTQESQLSSYLNDLTCTTLSFGQWSGCFVNERDDLVDLRAHILRRAFGRAELHDLFDTPIREPDEGA